MATCTALASTIAAQPLLSAGIYFAVYVIVTALSLPAASLLTLAGGALFGFGPGLLLVSFASTLGATLAICLLSYQTLVRDTPMQRFVG